MRFIRAWPSVASPTAWFVQVPGYPAKSFAFSKHGKTKTAARRYRDKAVRIANPPGRVLPPPRTKPMATNKLRVLGVHVYARRVVGGDGRVRVRRMAVAQVRARGKSFKRQFEIGASRSRRDAVALAEKAYRQLWASL